MITSDTKLMGLLGHDLKQSLSPIMHNGVCRSLGRDYAYCYFDVEQSQLEQTLRVLWSLGCLGLNVTMPHKVAVAALTDSQGNSSVNTLVRSNSGWVGYSTDGDGFIEGLERSQAEIQKFDSVIILGNGGVVPSVVEAMVRRNPNHRLDFVVLRRSSQNDVYLEKILPSQSSLKFLEFSPDCFQEVVRSTQGKRRLVIQATSAPKQGHTLAEFCSTMSLLTHEDFFVDLNYDLPSELYFEAIRRSLRCQDGLPMLIEQARLSQRLWFGRSSHYDEMLNAIRTSGWRLTIPIYSLGVP